MREKVYNLNFIVYFLAGLMRKKEGFQILEMLGDESPLMKRKSLIE